MQPSAPVQVFGKGGTNDVRANTKKRNSSENVSNGGPAEEGGEGAKVGLPVIGQQSTLIANN